MPSRPVASVEPRREIRVRLPWSAETSASDAILLRTIAAAIERDAMTGPVGFGMMIEGNAPSASKVFAMVGRSGPSVASRAAQLGLGQLPQDILLGMMAESLQDDVKQGPIVLTLVISGRLSATEAVLLPGSWTSQDLPPSGSPDAGDGFWIRNSELGPAVYNLSASDQAHLGNLLRQGYLYTGRPLTHEEIANVMRIPETVVRFGKAFTDGVMASLTL